MSIQSEIERLSNAKTTLAAAIEGKGVTVPESTKLDEMPALVESIQQNTEVLPHASSHGTGGSDPITPESIGAAPLKQWKDSTEAGVSLNDYTKPGFYVFSNVGDGSGNNTVSNLPDLGYNWTSDCTFTLFVSEFAQENNANIKTLVQYLLGDMGLFFRWGTYITDNGVPRYEFGSWTRFLDTDTHPRDIGALISNSETVTLTSNGWSNNEQTVATVNLTQWTLPSGITTGDVIISPAPASMSAYIAGSVYCSEQYAQGLKFKCDAVPSEDITVNILILK